MLSTIKKLFPGYLILIFLVIILVAILRARPNTPSSEEALSEALIDEEYFLSIPLCDQIRIFAQISPQYVDRGHLAVALPSWMHYAINDNPTSEIVDCITEEGFRRLALLSRMPENVKEISLSFIALVYKAHNLDLLGHPKLQTLLDQALCESELWYSGSIVAVYYLAIYDLPDYFGSDDTYDRMKSELCQNRLTD